MKLKEGAKVSTGFRSKISLLFADNSVFVVKSLTQMTITRFLQAKDTIETKIKLHIGNIRLKVKDNQSVKTDLKVTTFNTTCSVRGTEVKEIETSPDLGDIFSVASGHVLIENLEKKIRHLRGGETTDQNLIHPIEYALMQAVLSVQPYGVTVLEMKLALTSIAVPVLPDILIGDLNSETGNPVVEDVINQETGSGRDSGGGEEPPPEPPPPPCGLCHICSCTPCACD